MRALVAVLLLSTTACATSSTSSDSTATGWVEIAPMTVARSEHPGVALDGEVIVIGGFIEVGVGRTGVTDTVEAFNPVTSTWSELPRLPAPIHHGMATAVSDRLFVIGGYSETGDAVNTVWEMVDGAWAARSPLPQPVAAGAAVALDDSIYVVGGTPQGGLYRYDTAEDVWSGMAAPDQQREHVAAAVFEGEVWAIAGRWLGEIFDSTEIFDPDSGSWRNGPTLTEARSGFGAAVVGDTLVVAGGEVFEPDQALSSVELLSAGAGQWAMIDSLPHGVHGNPLVTIGAEVYLPGGSTRAAGIENDGRSYRITLG
jgi:N-acetylneuraminic acid mutarotase